MRNENLVFFFLTQSICCGYSDSDLIWPFLRPYMGVIPNPKKAFIFPISCSLALIFPILIKYFSKCEEKGSFLKPKIKSLSEEPSKWGGSFEHPKHMLKLMGKKTLAILHWNFLFFVYLNLCMTVPLIFLGASCFSKLLSTTSSSKRLRLIDLLELRLSCTDNCGIGV